MAKHKSIAQLWIEELARRKESANRGGSTNLNMDPSAREQINQLLAKAGRGPLTNREILQGHLDRTPDMTFEQAIASTNWKPVMPKGDDSPLAAEIAAAEARVREAQIRAMSPAERELYNLKMTQQSMLQKQADTEAVAAWFAKPEVKSALERLTDLRTRAAMDPTWSYADTQKVEQALAQWNTPGSDTAVGQELLNTAFGIVEAKRQAVIAQVKLQRAELDEQIAELNGGTPASLADRVNELNERHCKLWDQHGGVSPESTAVFKELEAARAELAAAQ